MKQIPLSQGKFALVDDEDYEFLNRHKWYAMKSGKTFYARRNIMLLGKRKGIFMHNTIIPTLPNKEIDHINGNGLDNQKSNLRSCSHRENTRNRVSQSATESGFRGVYWNPNNKRWFVSIKTITGLKHVGYFDDKKEAAQHYNLAAKEHFGKFAKYNNVSPRFPFKAQPAHSANNKSGFLGVCFDKKTGKWKSAICWKGIRKHLGFFDTPETAAIAYDEMSKLLRGEKAKLNFR